MPILHRKLGGRGDAYDIAISPNEKEFPEHSFEGKGAKKRTINLILLCHDLIYLKI